MMLRALAPRAQGFPALVLAVLLALSVPAAAQLGDTTYRLPDPALEERARAVGRELRCLVCQNQSIEDSDATLARDLRILVRERIAAGATDAETLRFVHTRYGDFVLLRPPVRGATLLLWGTPLVAVLAGGVILWRLRRRPAALGDTELSAAEQARLRTLQGSDRA